MIYPYFCDHCDLEFDVTKSMHDSSREEKCFTCGKIAQRIYSPNVSIIGAAVESPEYNPAFGQVIKNKRHRDEMAKRKGMIEIGNEKPETIQKHFEEQRAAKQRKIWEAD